MSVTGNILKVKNVQGVITSIKDRFDGARLVNQEYQLQNSWYKSKKNLSEKQRKTIEEHLGLFSYTADEPFPYVPLDVVVRYTPETSTTVTSNPTQMGVNVNDHVYDNPNTMTVTFGMSDIKGTISRLYGVIKSFTSVDALKNPQTPSRSLLDLLFRAKQEHTLLSLDDGLHNYTNMVITNITYDKDKTTYRSLVATVTLQQMIFVNTLEADKSTSRVNPVPGTASKYSDIWDRITAVRLV